MNEFLVSINVAVLLLLVAILYFMQKKHVSFSIRVFVALGLGIVFGLGMQSLYGGNKDIIKASSDWFSLLGTGYVKLLQMIIIPLIMVSILSAIVNLKDSKALGKISGLIIGVLLLTTAISAGVGIATANTFKLSAIEITQGDAEKSRADYLNNKLTEVKKQSVPQRILEVIPANPFADMTGARSSSTLAVVIFSALVGVAALGVRKKHPEQAETFKQLIDAIYAVVMRLVQMVLRLTPYGVLAIMAKTVADTSFLAIVKLAKFVGASYVALITVFIIHLVILAIFKLNPVVYLKKIFPVLSFAFTSRSSAATLPLTIDTQTKKLGVGEGIANFSSTFGTAIGQNGCAGIYPAMLAVMIAPTIGISPLDPRFIVSLIFVVALSSFGIAGVGGGATFAAVVVLSSMGLPVGLAGLLISVEPLIDMGRTALNVSGSVIAGLVSGRILKDVNVEVYNSKDMEVSDLENANI